MIKLSHMSITEEIKKARKEAGLTQAQLAEKCQDLGNMIYQPDIADFESGAQNPARSKLEMIAKVLGMEWKLISKAIEKEIEKS